MAMMRPEDVEVRFTDIEARFRENFAEHVGLPADASTEDLVAQYVDRIYLPDELRGTAEAIPHIGAVLDAIIELKAA